MQKEGPMVDQNTELEAQTERIVVPTREQYPEIVDVINSEADLYQVVFTADELESLEVGDFSVEELIAGEATRNYLILEIDGTVTGFSSWYQKNDKVAWLSMLHVSSDHQGKGVGTKLLLAVEGCVKQLGLSALALEAQRKAEWAVGFYLKRGYSILNWEDLNTEPYIGTLNKLPVEATHVFGKVLE